MSATAARVGAGTTLGIDPAGGSSYTLVAENVEIIPYEASRPSVKATHLTSDDDHDEFIPAGFVDSGTLSFTANYIYANLDTYDDLLLAGTIFTFQIITPDGATGAKFSGRGFFTKVRPLSDLKPDATTPMRFMAEIKITGKITRTAPVP